MATTVREDGVWRQTRTLLLKNYLVKCRTKKGSVQVSPRLPRVTAVYFAFIRPISKRGFVLPDAFLL